MNTKYLLPLLSIVVLSNLVFSCKTNNEISAEQKKLEETRQGMAIFSAKTTEYRGFSPEIPFFDPVKDGNNPQIAIQNRKAFINASGLPNEENIVEFKKNHTFSQAYNLYKKYLNDNTSSPYVETFRQYGAW